MRSALSLSRLGVLVITLTGLLCSGAQAARLGVEALESDASDHNWSTLALELFEASEELQQARLAATRGDWPTVLRMLDGLPDSAALRALRNDALRNTGELEELEIVLRRELDEAADPVPAALALSTQLASVGKVSEAIDIMAALADEHGDDPRWHVGQARLKAMQAQPFSAAQSYERAIELEGTRSSTAPTPTEMELAGLLSRTGGHAGVRELLERFENADATDARVMGALMMLVEADLQLLDKASATRRLSIVREVLGPSAQVRTFEARILALGGNLDEAVGLLGSIGTVPALMQLSTAQDRAGRPGDATDSLERAARRAREELQVARILQQLVTRLIETGDQSRALGALDEALQRWPGSVELRFLRAGTLYSFEEFEAGVEEVKGLLTRLPDLAPAVALHSKLLWQLGQRDEAAALMERATELDPKRMSHWVEFLYMAHHIGGHPQMLGIIERGLAINPGHPELLLERAQIEDEEGRFDVANGIYRDLIRRDEFYVRAYLNLAINLARANGKSAEALRLVTRANSLAPRDPVVRGTFGWILGARGDMDNALRYLSQAVESLPHSGLFRYRYGSVLARAGESEAARLAIEKAIELGLNRSDLKLAEALLKQL